PHWDIAFLRLAPLHLPALRASLYIPMLHSSAIGPAHEFDVQSHWLAKSAQCFLQLVHAFSRIVLRPCQRSQTRKAQSSTLFSPQLTALPCHTTRTSLKVRLEFTMRRIRRQCWFVCSLSIPPSDRDKNCHSKSFQRFGNRSDQLARPRDALSALFSLTL